MPSVILPPDAVGGILHITDHLARAKASVIEQYRDKTKFNGLLTPFVNQIQKLENAFWDLMFRADLSHANLVPNAGFESDSDGDGLADFWAGYNNSTGLEPHTMSLVPGKFGKLAQRIKWSVNNTTQKGVALVGSPANNVYGGWKPNTTYYQALWARATGTNVGAGVIANGWNTLPTTQTDILNPFLADDWQLYSKLITWGSSVEILPIGGLYITISGGTQGALDFDGVVIVEGSTAWRYETLGSFFDLLGRILGEPRNGRFDESYRRFLLAKIIANRSSGTAEDFYSIFRAILGAGYAMKVQDISPKIFIASITSGAVADSTAADLAALMRKTKDAGASGSFEYGNTAPFFGFDGNGSGFDTGYFGGTL